MTPDQLAQLVLLAYAAIAVGLVLLSVRRCRDGWRVWLLYFVNRLFVAFIFHWRANGRCPYPESSGAIILSNHRSPLDPMLAWMNSHLRSEEPARSIRVIGYLMAREYYEQPGLVGWIGRAMQSIPVDRNGRDIGPTREAIRRLERGDLIGIFPEGGINMGEGLREANPGIAFLALKAGVPVIPVYIHGAPQGESMTEPFYTPSRVRVIYGTPIDLSPWQGQRKSQELLQILTDALMRKLADLGGVRYTPSVNETK
ncbi:MAG: 1-acyl-sn-glycerol-3-phosphate acyltransferase [Planctomycetota bacterium]|nr:MAG: 1-acyl-sn-glycerol-3-phosphate acyltransferase [Planctomycetota bacterium]GDY08120.1 1-acyl-sn-glycerol-3-phosphate acyltransferase [Planctomycetia bacterium]